MGDRGSLGGKGATGGPGEVEEERRGEERRGRRVGDVVTGFKMEGVETILKKFEKKQTVKVKK